MEICYTFIEVLLLRKEVAGPFSRWILFLSFNSMITCVVSCCKIFAPRPEETMLATLRLIMNKLDLTIEEVNEFHFATLHYFLNVESKMLF